MDLDETRSSFRTDLKTLKDGIDTLLNQPEHSNIEQTQGRIKKILGNKEYNEIPDIRKAFEALHKLDGELASLDGVFTYGGSINKEDLKTISSLMQETLMVVPASPSTADLENEATQSLLHRSREAIRAHDYEGAAVLLRRLPEAKDRNQRLEGLVRSMIDLRESMVKTGERKDMLDASKRCFAIGEYIQDPTVRYETMLVLFNKLLKEDADPNFLVTFTKFFPAGYKIQVLIEILKLKITDEEYEDILKEGPPNEPLSDLYSRLYIYTLQREGKL